MSLFDWMSRRMDEADNDNEHCCDECGMCTDDKSRTIYIESQDKTLCLECASDALG
ncbi:hypothetical protein [Oxalicibacterium faecigallinarum]|uniref:Uncharacterized protein n=1 Tax=Oxalicibacterium faecigallinarum TaxID=573741 RepID=A0A8J3AT77_9BURK|nr:hypothetical protein [Oxalicibacterium faecigallinarum]GGI21075.1 hypothetical protein GCM10008066_27250 [Oxalicibacterium faecigallinarum]